MKKERIKFNDTDEFSFGNNTPLFSSLIETNKLIVLLNKSIESIKLIDNPRIIIIETWLILDYFIRDFIVSGLNLNIFCYEDFDLKYELLPQSFDRLVKFLEEFIKQQGGLEKDIKANEVDFYGKFAYFIIKVTSTRF